MGRKVSMRKIAELCNVSPSTVSRFLSGKGSFTEETQTLILETMRREGYPLPESVPQLQEDSAQFPKTIGFVSSSPTSEFFSTIQLEFERCLGDGYLPMHLYSYMNQEREKRCVRALQEKQAEGLVLVLASSDLPDETLGSTPAVFIAHPSVAERYPDRYFVFSDDYVGGRMAAQELLRKGCKTPIVLYNRQSDLAEPAKSQMALASDRVRGFVDEFSQAGIALAGERVLLADLKKTNIENAKDTVAYLLAKRMPFDSVFACNDWLAYGALVALRTAGISVPEEVKIIGFDGSEIAVSAQQPITTIRQNPERIAQVAHELLMALINGETPAPRQTMVPVSFFEGATT